MCAVKMFYSQMEEPFQCKIVPAFDKKGYIIETEYKLTNGYKKVVYTLNLYHTGHTGLVNGKK